VLDALLIRCYSCSIVVVLGSRGLCKVSNRFTLAAAEAVCSAVGRGKEEVVMVCGKAL
jgi:hypothetical protein